MLALTHIRTTEHAHTQQTHETEGEWHTHNNPAASRIHKNDDNDNGKRDDDDNKRARNHDDSQMRQQSHVPGQYYYRTMRKMQNKQKRAIWEEMKKAFSTHLTREMKKNIP